MQEYSDFGLAVKLRNIRILDYRWNSGLFGFWIMGKIQEYSDFELSVKCRNIRILNYRWSSGIFEFWIIGEIQEYSGFELSVKFRNLVLFSKFKQLIGINIPENLNIQQNRCEHIKPHPRRGRLNCRERSECMEFYFTFSYVFMTHLL